MRTLTLRELNRTLLSRQFLLERKRISVAKAVERLVGLQAQYAPSPYVALWSRIDGFHKEQLTNALIGGAVVKAGSMRTTLHVMSASDYPSIAAAYIESQRGRTEGLGVDLEALRAAIPDEPLTSVESFELAYRVLDTSDRWTAAFALRALPGIRTAPVGPWPHTKPSSWVLWREPLPEQAAAAVHVVRRYLLAYGPASREDIAQFTYFKFRQIDPALEGLRTFADDEGRTLFDLPRAPLAPVETDAPVRFLPAFDSIILAHRDRSRIVPAEYAGTVFNTKNATTKQTFTVDGFVAGAWRIERKRGRWQIELEPFAPLPAKWRREVTDEGERLVAFYES